MLFSLAVIPPPRVHSRIHYRDTSASNWWLRFTPGWNLDTWTSICSPIYLSAASTCILRSSQQKNSFLEISFFFLFLLKLKLKNNYPNICKKQKYVIYEKVLNWIQNGIYLFVFFSLFINHIWIKNWDGLICANLGNNLFLFLLISVRVDSIRLVYMG